MNAGEGNEEGYKLKGEMKARQGGSLQCENSRSSREENGRGLITSIVSWGRHFGMIECDFGTSNMNNIILTVANESVKDCKGLGLFFRELEA